MMWYREAHREWGEKPARPQAEPIRAYKFMRLNRPQTEEFGGHWSMTGSYGKTFYSPTMIATCGSGQSHPAPDVDCTCGIYSQKLDNVHSGHDFHNEGTLCQLDLSGRVLKATKGYKSQAATVYKIWPGREVLSDQDKYNIRRDLGVEVGDVPVLGSGGYNSYSDWRSLIDNDPELHSQHLKEITSKEH